MNFVAVDFETANRNPGSVCSVGLVVVIDGVISERLQWLIKPNDSIFDHGYYIRLSSNICL